MLKPYIFSLSVFLLICSGLFAQAPGCPSIYAGNDTSVTCTNSCVTLNANVFSAQQTTSYTVSGIPYVPPYPYNQGTQIFIGIDDIWSNSIPLPFPFCFYGNTYNNIVIGTNGLISFNTAYANGFCPWSFSASVPSPVLPVNAVFGAYHDIDPSICGEIRYQLLGNFPCRTLVVNFNQVCHFSCNNLQTTQQIILYETTNVIEVYVESKPTCNTWNQGNALIGIQNATGSTGLTPPSRNTGSWTTVNEAWRFSPSGAPNYTVNWSSGGSQIGTGTSISVCPTVNTTFVAEATYTGCSGQQVIVSDSVTVTAIGLVSLSTSSTAASCGQNDGTATVTASGTGPFSYSWNTSPVQTTDTATNLPAGNYTVTVTDSGAACPATATVNVPQNNNLSLTASVISPNSCFADSSAIAEVIVTGNTGSLSYQWNDPYNQTTSQADSLPAGTWQVVVTDGLCADSITVTIVNPPSISVSITSPPACNGQATTYAIATATGGTGSAFNYQWNDPNSTNNDTVTNLLPGTYIVQVTDSLGCTVTDSVITSSSPPISSSFNSQQVTCPNYQNGSATVFASGGSGTFTYSWDTNPVQTTQTITGIGAGFYTAVSTDGNGCTDTAVVSITNLSNISLADTVLNQVTCFGGSNGAAQVISTGNAGVVNYLWTPGNYTTDSITGLSSNTYMVIGTDTVGCADTTFITINEPAEIDFVVTANPALCNGASTGSVSVNNATGGTPGYTYSWNTIPPQTTQIVTGLSAGYYVITVTDSNLCTNADTVQVLEPAAFNITPSQTNISCNGQNDGTATVTVSGGAGGFTYSWSTNPVQTGATAVSLSQGTYSVLITDANSCQDTVEAIIYEPSPVVSTISSEQTACGDSLGTATVNGNGGIPPYSYTWSSSGQTGQNANGLWSGYHYVTVTDANGCTKQDSVYVGQYLGVAADYYFTIDVIDENEAPLDVSFTNQSTFSNAGTKPVTYTWNFGDGAFSNEMNPMHTFNTDGDFDVWMKVCYAAICCDSVNKRVEVLDPLLVPNVFSPNGDGINDVFKVKNKNLTQLSIQIFNRWGLLVFETETVGETWNGNKKNDGSACPDGTYFYILNATRKDGKEVDEKFKKGTITLLR